MAYEDFFNDYTEVDAGTSISILEGTPNKITCAGMTANEDSYVYRDAGANHFGALDHDVEFELTDWTGNVSGFAFWGISNEIDDLLNATGGILAHMYYWDGYVYNEILEAGEDDDFDQIEDDTHYYVDVVRSNNTVTVTIFDDEGKTNEICEHSIILTGTGNRQYIFGMSSKDGNDNDTAGGYAQNLELNEAVGAVSPTGALNGPLVGPLGGPI